MSLINDAIKQANKANKDRASSAPAPGTLPTTGMQTTEPRTAPASAASMTGTYLVAGIVLFVLLGGTLLFLAMRNVDDGGPPDQTQLSSPAPSAPPASAVTAPTPAPASAAQPTLPAATAPAKQSVAAGPTPAAETPAVLPAATPTLPPPTADKPASPSGPRPFPELKLQGIYYRIKDPSVMINGKTLMIGDLISDVTVTRIERKEVTVELDGQQKVLRLQ